MCLEWHGGGRESRRPGRRVGPRIWGEVPSDCRHIRGVGLCDGEQEYTYSETVGSCSTCEHRGDKSSCRLILLSCHSRSRVARTRSQLRGNDLANRARDHPPVPFIKCILYRLILNLPVFTLSAAGGHACRLAPDIRSIWAVGEDETPARSIGSTHLQSRHVKNTKFLQV